MIKLNDCIKKAETCGYRDFQGKCHLKGCIVKHKKSLTPMERFVFGLNPYERKQLDKMLGRDEL
jgi:hypothetical protein